MMVLPAYAILVTAAFIIVLAAVATAFHERNWRRLLAEYADLRRANGAPAEKWPTFSMTLLLGLKPGLLLALAGLASVGVVMGAWAAIAWPQPAPFAVLPVADRNLPLVWAATGGAAGFVAALLSVTALVRISPWAAVSRALHRAIYAKGDARKKLLEQALAADPQVTRAQPA